VIRCFEFDDFIRRPVLECSGYEQRGAMTKHEMKRIGWILVQKRGIGFVSPSDKRYKELVGEEPIPEVDDV
jgi:hypothetical protein